MIVLHSNCQGDCADLAGSPATDPEDATREAKRTDESERLAELFVK
jgi:hypothetical protein